MFTIKKMPSEICHKVVSLDFENSLKSIAKSNFPVECKNISQQFSAVVVLFRSNSFLFHLFSFSFSASNPRAILGTHYITLLITSGTFISTQYRQKGKRFNNCF